MTESGDVVGVVAALPRPSADLRWRGPRAAVVLGAAGAVMVAAAAIGVWIGSVGIHPAALLGLLWNALPFADVEPW